MHNEFVFFNFSKNHLHFIKNRASFLYPKKDLNPHSNIRSVMCYPLHHWGICEPAGIRTQDSHIKSVVL